MSEVMSKALLCGLGLASLTKDAIQKTAENLVKQSKISEEEGRKFAKDLERRSKQARTALEKEVDTAVHKMLQHLDLAAIINDRLKDAKPAAKENGKPAAKAAKKVRRSSGASMTVSR